MKEKIKTNKEKAIQAEQLLEEAWENMDEQHCGKAMPLADNAVTIYRSLAYEEPLIYDPMLAYSYNTLGMAYVFMHLFDDAEDAYARAVFFARKSQQQNPADEHLRMVARYLYSYSNVLRNEEKLEQAYKAIHEAADILTILKRKGSDCLPSIHKEILVLCDVIGEQIDPHYWGRQLENLR